MLEYAKAELGTAVIGTDSLPPQELAGLFSKANDARTPGDLLGCLTALEDRRIPIAQPLEEAVAQCLPAGVRHLAADIAFKMLDKLPAAVLRELFDSANSIDSVSSLVRFLLRLRGQGMTLDDLLPAQMEAPQDAPAQEEVVVPANGNVTKSRLPRMVEGMRPHHESGEFRTTPQKDFVRAKWGEFVRENLGADPEVNKDRRVFALLGEKALELPIYRAIGIPDANVYSAEYDPKVHAHMAAQGVSFNLVPGNCLDFCTHLKATAPAIRFDVANLDLCGSAREFFMSGDQSIVTWLAPLSVMGFNSRIRQDSAGLDTAFVDISFLAAYAPEFEEYVDALVESKKTLFSPDVAKNMTLREIEFVWRLVEAWPSKTPECCRGAIDAAQKYLNNFVAAFYAIEKRKHPEGWDARSVADKMEHLLGIVVYDDKFSDTVSRLPDGYMRAVRKELGSKFKIERNKLVSADGTSLAKKPTEEFSRDELRQILPEGLTPKGTESPEELERYYGAYKELMDILRQVVVRIQTTCTVDRRVTAIRRFTYSYGAQHTFQTWMVRTEPRDKPATLLEAVAETLDVLINSPETVIDGRMEVKEWQTDPVNPRKVVIPPERVLDFHKAKKRARNAHQQLVANVREARRKTYAPKEIKLAKKRRKMARESRRIQRWRRK